MLLLTFFVQTSYSYSPLLHWPLFLLPSRIYLRDTFFSVERSDSLPSLILLAGTPDDSQAHHTLSFLPRERWQRINTVVVSSSRTITPHDHCGQCVCLLWHWLRKVVGVVWLTVPPHPLFHLFYPVPDDHELIFFTPFPPRTSVCHSQSSSCLAMPVSPLCLFVCLFCLFAAFQVCLFICCCLVAKGEQCSRACASSSSILPLYPSSPSIVVSTDRVAKRVHAC